MNPPPAYWVHHLDPFLIHFSGNLGIRYYGLAYVLAFVGGWLLLRAAARAGRSPLQGEAIDDFIFMVVLGVLVGGRLGSFLLYDGWRKIPSDPLSLLRVWEGGMASHGGFVGVIVMVAWFARRRRIPFLQLGDLIVSVVPLGLLLGRLANFINGELWGKPSTVPWAVIFPLSAPPGTPVDQILPRHPSQLYEAGLEGALLLAWMQWRFWRTDVMQRQPGQLGGEFLAGYALVRIIGEVFREPDQDVTLILGLSRGTFYSVFVLVAGVALIVFTPKKPAGSPPPA